MRFKMQTLGAAAVLGLLATAGFAQDSTIKVGVVQPQAGECAQWGVPITRLSLIHI